MLWIAYNARGTQEKRLGTMAKRIKTINKLIDEQAPELIEEKEQIGKDLQAILEYELNNSKNKANLIYVLYRAYALGYANGKEA